jgi:hypothetical protein
LRHPLCTSFPGADTVTSFNAAAAAAPPLLLLLLLLLLQARDQEPINSGEVYDA